MMTVGIGRPAECNLGGRAGFPSDEEGQRPTRGEGTNSLLDTLTRARRTAIRCDRQPALRIVLRVTSSLALIIPMHHLLYLGSISSLLKLCYELT